MSLPDSLAGWTAVAGFGAMAAVGACSLLSGLLSPSPKVAGPSPPSTTSGGRKLGSSSDDTAVSQQEQSNRLGVASKRLLAIAKVAFWPTVACAAITVFAIKADAIFAMLPPSFGSHAGVSVDAQIAGPLQINDAMQAFKIGIAWRDANGSFVGTPQEIHVRRAFEDILNRSKLTMEDIKSLPAIMEKQDSVAKSGSRILAMFSVVNAIWLFSILGLTLLAIPVGFIFMEPIMRGLAHFWRTVLVPAYLESRPFHPILLFGASLLIAFESARFPRNDKYTMAGTMYGVCSLCVFGLSFLHEFAWSTARHLRRASAQDYFLEGWALGQVGVTLTSLTAAALAHLHHSTVLGTVSAGLALIALTSTQTLDFITMKVLRMHCVVPSTSVREVWMWERIPAACLALASTLAAGNACHLPMQPFSTVLNILGSAGYCVCLGAPAVLEGTSQYKYYFYNHHAGHPLTLRLSVSLLALFGLGVATNSASIRGTAMVYGLIFTLAKGLMRVSDTVAWYLTGTLTSGALFGLAFLLSKHPEMVSGLISLGL